MSQTPMDPEAVIDAMAPLLRLEIDPDCRPGIVLNLDVTAKLAALVLEFPLGDRAESSALFRP